MVDSGQLENRMVCLRFVFVFVSVAGDVGGAYICKAIHQCLCICVCVLRF